MGRMTHACGRREALLAAAAGLGVPLVVVESAGEAQAAGAPVIATSRVPVGGGVVVARRGVVVTQPRRGRFKVFTATCTHAGCTVSGVAERRITCPCHGSQFAITTGAVLAGPAPSPLAARAFTIRDGRIYLT